MKALLFQTTPPNQNPTHDASGKDFSSAQATEAIPGASKLLCKDEREEAVGQKLSEAPNFLADAPKPSSSTMGSIQQKDLEGLMVTGGLHQWEPEGSARMGAVQQELLEEMAELKAWQPEKPLAGGQDHEELEKAGRAMRTWQKEQKETEGDEQEAPGGEEQRGLDGATQTGGLEQQVAKMVEDLRSEPDADLVGEAKMESNQQEEPDIEVGDEGVQPAVPGSAETGGDQQGEPGEEVETRSHPQREPEEKFTLEVQEEDPVRVTEEEDGQQRGLEGSESEGPQLGKIEGFLRDEGTHWREQNEKDSGEKSVMEEQRGDRTAWTGRFQQEMAKMMEDLQSDPDGQLPAGTNAEDNLLEESDIETGDEEVQPTVPDGDQEGESEGKAEARSYPQWEPKERVFLEVQEENLKEITEKGGSQQRGLEEAEMEAHQQGELEGSVRNKETQRREQEENKGEEQEATGGEESVMEEQRKEGTAWTGRSQQEVGKMAEGLWLEVEVQLSGGAENYQQGESDMETGDEGAWQTMLDGAETRRDQQEGLEREAEARSSPLWGPKETVTLEIQDPSEVVTEREDSQQMGLEEAEMEDSQQSELEGFLRDEWTQWREQEENEGDRQVATCGEQQSGDGTAWTERSQQEAAKMADGQWLEAEEQLVREAKAKNSQQGEPDMETRGEGSQQVILDGAETGGDQQGGQEGESEIGRDLSWKPKKTVNLEEHPEKGLEGTGEREEHQHGKLEGSVGNEAENEEGQEEQMKEPGLERGQQKDPEVSIGITVLDEVVEAAMMEQSEVQGQEARETEGTERSLPHEPLGDKAPDDTCCLAGAGAFPGEVPSLDTSAQKERVLLRRKSSIRRAPSLKRPRPPTETPPPQETGIEENSPSQPPPSGRPHLRHAGFGPMHPNMMAELQMRLRRPQ
ncbi:trichohyalin-like [Heteronotia binoei]|uniref:trichohyalin-like n=1 Tax=Heteronotia binoei TaxID=13085 RepID=UPI00292D526E|nr:trichohyalin-like [Heteronotia binoei]